jgi:endoglucanase
MINIPLLSEICRIPGAPGFEQRVRSFLIEQLEGLVDEIEADAMGNLIAIRRGRADDRLMITAHMDEISFITTYITNEGFIKFHTLGGFDPKTLTSQRVIIHGKEDVIGVMGTKPIHTMTLAEKKVPSKVSDYFIDTGLPAKEVKKLIKVGDPITRERTLIEMGNCVNSKSIDNRVSVFILLETLKKLKDHQLPCDLYAVFTVQEEVGLRGAIAASSGIDPDFGINLDVTLAYDLPGAAPHEKITSLGEGTAIKVLDGATICDYRMVEFMKGVAEEENIKYQMEVLPAGGTDTAGMQRHSNGGCIAGGISIPTRYLHQVIEMADKSDISDTIDLLTQCILRLDNYDWSFK